MAGPVVVSKAKAENHDIVYEVAFGFWKVCSVREDVGDKECSPITGNMNSLESFVFSLSQLLCGSSNHVAV